MTKRRDLATIRLDLADASKRITAWRLGLAALQVTLGRGDARDAAELHARLDDTVRVLGVLRNELDALLGLLDGDDRPTPVHPYAPICDSCDTCAHRRARLKGKK
jgi:hypothetical protein